MTRPSISPVEGLPEIEAAMHGFAPAPDSLAGRVVLITGASGGVGGAAAHACLAAGAEVILSARDPKRIDPVYDALVATFGDARAPALLYLDQLGAGMDDYEQVAAAVVEQFGRLDGLVHAAAYLGELATFTSYSPEQWARVMQVNVNSAFLLTHTLMRALHLSKDPSVVFVSDRVGRQGRAYWGAYAASKFALEGMMQVLAHEFEPLGTARANSWAPGPLCTRLRADAYPGELPESQPAPESVIADLVYLLGPNAQGVNGKALNARGNMTVTDGV